MLGAILSGGASARMGTPKHALVLPDGRTMIEHVHAALATVCTKIVTLSEHEILRGVVQVPDRTNHLGPLGGLEALLASGLSSDYILVPCDMPRLTGDILRALLVATARPITALRVKTESAPRPLPLRLSDSLLPLIRARIDAGNLSVQGLLEAAEVEIVIAPPEWECALENINTPEEYASLRHSLQPQRPIE